jgi:hypothetical protein
MNSFTQLELVANSGLCGLDSKEILSSLGREDPLYKHLILSVNQPASYSKTDSITLLAPTHDVRI